MNSPISQSGEKRQFSTAELGGLRRSMLRPTLGLAADSSKDDRTLQALMTILWRQRMFIAVVILLSLGGAVAYLLLAAPQFTATARMVIDTKRARTFQANPAPDGIIDSSVVASQIEIVKSEVVAEMVIKRLGLLKDPEFTTPRLGTFDAIVEGMRHLASFAGPKFSKSIVAVVDRVFGSGLRQDTAGHNLTIAVSNFEQSLEVNQIGRSYIAEVSFTSLDPVKAAAIANAVANAYIENKLDTRIYNIERADSWIRRRLVDLHAKYQKAADQLAKVKASSIGVGLTVTEKDARIAALEETVSSYKNIYETSVNLSRYVQSVQEQAFPITEARIISQAAAPLHKSYPKVKLTVLAALMIGGALGGVSALAMGLRDRRIWSRAHVEGELGTRCLGFMRHVRGKKVAVSHAGKQLQRLGVPPVLDDCGTAERGGGILRALRATAEARLPGEKCRVLGITSANDGDGKTTVAVNLATVLVECGRRVLLIGNPRDFPSASGLAAYSGGSELSEIAANRTRLADAVTEGPFGSLLVVERRTYGGKHSADVWCSTAVGKLMAQAAKQYDYIIIDFPSLLTSVDAEAATEHVDAFVLVAKYASTTIDDLRRALDGAPNAAGRLLGLIVNFSGA